MNILTRSRKTACPFFLPYQERWIRDGARYKVMEKARQVGMSWAAAYRAVSTSAQAGNRLDCWVSSRDQVQGRLFMDDCARWADVLEAGAKDFGDGVIDSGGRGGEELHFANGCALRSLTSSVDAQAGKRGSRILDEFALHEDPRRLFAVAAPGITWGGTLEILSTHRGSGNFFNKLIQQARDEGNPKGISLHRVTLQDAVREGLLSKLKKKLPKDDPRQDMDEDSYLQFVHDGCPDEESWLEEYCCVPSDDAAAFIPLDLIRRAEYPSCAGGAGAMGKGRDGRGLQSYDEWDVPMAELRSGCVGVNDCAGKEAFYLGVDLGREHDLSVFWLLGVGGDGCARTRKLIVMEKTPFSVQEERLYELLKLPALKRCCIDASGLGRQFAERAVQRFGQRRVEGLTLSAPVKEELAYPVRAAFENGAILIPPVDGVRADLRSVRREVAAGGSALRFTAERGRYGHADRFWALALALRAARFGEEKRGAYVEGFGAQSAASHPARVTTDAYIV